MEIMKTIADQIRNNIVLWLAVSLTLGLAPFAPEPHIWGKLKWLAGGAVGMKGADWGDLIMHGAPWLLLISSIVLRLIQRNKA
jgi:hypothetical protein